MKPPIFVDNNGDVSEFASVNEAEKYMEPIDVKNGEYVVTDSLGVRLGVHVVEEIVPLLFGLIKVKNEVVKIKSLPLEAYPEDLIRQHALKHLAVVLRMPESLLRYEMRFDRDITATPASVVKLNEFDAIDEEIKSVADKSLLKEMEKGAAVIQTVGDYCDHMVRCSAIKPDEVARVLRLPETDVQG